MDIFVAAGIIIVCILISLTLHEAMHAYVSHWLGDDTAYHEGRLTLNPIAHIDPILTVLLPLGLYLVGLPPFGAAKPVPFNPYKVRGGDWGAALVGAAGPLTNLALALVGGLLLQLNLSSLTHEIIEIFIGVNVAFFIFNMIPFPPLDGSRILYAVAPDGVRSVMRAIENTGFLGIVVFMFFIFPLLRPVFLEVYQAVIRLVS